MAMHIWCQFVMYVLRLMIYYDNDMNKIIDLLRTQDSEFHIGTGVGRQMKLL